MPIICCPSLVSEYLILLFTGRFFFLCNRPASLFLFFLIKETRFFKCSYQIISGSMGSGLGYQPRNSYRWPPYIYLTTFVSSLPYLISFLLLLSVSFVVNFLEFIYCLPIKKGLMAWAGVLAEPVVRKQTGYKDSNYPRLQGG